MTAIELFSGAGGMALGFEQAGFDILAAVDLDPVHLAAHERNFPLCEPVCDDVATLPADQLLSAAQRGWARRYPKQDLVGTIDCIFGGPSCQGFSVMGRQDPQDPRNALVAAFARVVAEVRPRWFVLENVPGLVSPSYRPVLNALYRRLRKAGYQVAEPWTLNAAAHHVAQVRKRIFIVGARHDQALPAPPTGGAPTATVLDALNDLAGLGSYGRLYDSDELDFTKQQLSRLQARQSGYVRQLNGITQDKGDLSDRRHWDPALLTSVGLTVHSDEVVSRFDRLAPGERDQIGRLPRLDPLRQSPTLRAGTGRDHGSFTSARPIHYRSPRVITVREAARLHGFPDWFGFHSTKWHGFRQVGNAVPPPLARAVARSVVKASEEAPARRRGSLVLGSAHLLNMPMAEAAKRYDLEPSRLPINVRRGSVHKEAA